MYRALRTGGAYLKTFSLSFPCLFSFNTFFRLPHSEDLTGQILIATSNFMNEVYHEGFAPELSVSMLEEIIAPVWDYVYKARKYKAKLAKKI